MNEFARTLPAYVLLGLIGIVTGIATYLGGALALRLRQHIRLILGFSAGAVVGVALLDLLPETLELGAKTRSVGETATFVVAGFATYMLLDRFLRSLTGGPNGRRGHLGAASLTIHSVLDGFGIGLAFHVSAAAAGALALAVLAHDFSDGVNTVNLSLQGTGSPRAARWWLLADATAPLAGIMAAQLISVDRGQLALLLALFTGVFLYIGASELLPESHDQHPHTWTSVTTLIGMSLIWAVVHLSAL